MKTKGKKTDKKSLELTKTFVLNFNEVEQIAHYEKVVSKKPACIFAIIGLVAIAAGLLYPSVNSMIHKNNHSNEGNEFREESQVVNLSDSLTCTKTETNNEEFTTSVTTLTFKFDKECLSSYEKVLNIASTATTLTQTPQSMIELNNLINPLIQNPLSGYTLYKSMKNDQTHPNLVNNYTAKLVVDLKLYDYASLSEQYRANDFLNVVYNNNNTFSNIRSGLINTGYTCN